MLMSAVICKQKLLHKHEIVQLLHNYKFYDVEQSHFGKPFCQERKNVKNNYRKTVRSLLPAVQFVTGSKV